MKQKNEMVAIDINAVQSRILMVRDQQILLDRDVAALYGVETRAVNQAVKNNPEKFPFGYVFPLEKSEFECLKSKILISNGSQGRGGVRKLPTAFTEKGLYMLARGSDVLVAFTKRDSVDRIRNADGRSAYAPEYPLTSGEDAASPLRFAIPSPILRHYQVVKPCRDVENVEDMSASAAGIAPTLSSTRSTNLHGTDSSAIPAAPRRPVVGTARGLRLSRFARLFTRSVIVRRPFRHSLYTGVCTSGLWGGV